MFYYYYVFINMSFITIVADKKYSNLIRGIFDEYRFLVVRSDCPLKQLIEFLSGIRTDYENIVVMIYMDDYFSIDEVNAEIPQYVFAMRHYFASTVVQIDYNEYDLSPDYVRKKTIKSQVKYNKKFL